MKLKQVNGGIAQLVERCLCKADVSGSSPLISTTSLDTQELDSMQSLLLHVKHVFYVWYTSIK